MMLSPSERSIKIKELARQHGFQDCGIVAAKKLFEEENKLTSWLNSGYHGKMKYMENHFEKRLDPSKLVPGSKSVISLSYNYFPKEPLKGDLKLSKYAYGEDYHFVIKGKLRELLAAMVEDIGDMEARVFVDSAPVLERALAAKAGLGWIGKHSLLLNKKKGSFFFLAEIICDLELETDAPTTDHCGTCTACIDACPTDAIVADRVIDSNKCISYLTIELKDEIPTSFKNDMEGWIFGCDICQDVCPWNKFSKPHMQPAFEPKNILKGLHQAAWQDLTQEVFKDVFKKSAVKRAGFAKLKKSIDYCKAT